MGASSNSRVAMAVRPALPLPQLFNAVPKVPKPPPPPRREDVATPTRSLHFGAEEHTPATTAKSAPVSKAVAQDSHETQLAAAAEAVLQESPRTFPLVTACYSRTLPNSMPLQDCGSHWWIYAMASRSLPIN